MDSGGESSDGIALVYTTELQTLRISNMRATMRFTLSHFADFAIRSAAESVNIDLLNSHLGGMLLLKGHGAFR